MEAKEIGRAVGDHIRTFANPAHRDPMPAVKLRWQPGHSTSLRVLVTLFGWFSRRFPSRRKSTLVADRGIGFPADRESP
jgi:hypothetical protein